MLHFNCLSCQKRFSAPEEKVGLLLTCPACEQVLPVPIHASPIKHPELFVYHQQRYSGRTFPFRCAGCETIIRLRQRITQNQRVCPGCGSKIIINKIDQQVEEMEVQWRQMQTLEREKERLQREKERLQWLKMKRQVKIIGWGFVALVFLGWLIRLVKHIGH